MANSYTTPNPIPSSMPPAAPSPLSSKKDNVAPVNSKITELSESRVELLNRIQGLKQDIQGWRSKLETQVKIYRDELSGLKQMLNVEVDQLRSEFQELRTTLQQQQEDVTTGLRNLGLQEVTGETEDEEPKVNNGKTLLDEKTGKETEP